jgi:hypothetical protein
MAQEGTAGSSIKLEDDDVEMSNVPRRDLIEASDDELDASQ